MALKTITYDDSSSSLTINDWVKVCYENSKAHGFHDDMENLLKIVPDYLRARILQLFITEKLALITSEDSECLEDVRDGNMEEIEGPKGKPLGFPSELADVVIRCFDLAGMLNINLEGAIIRKHAFNKSRPMKHGRKF